MKWWNDNENDNENDNVIEYKWYDDNSTDINNLLIFLKTVGGSYYDENNEILYGPDITNISLEVSYEITNYEKGFRNKYHEYIFFDNIPVADKDLSLILNENYGTITFNWYKNYIKSYLFYLLIWIQILMII